jgi:hypothetical protein
MTIRSRSALLAFLALLIGSASVQAASVSRFEREFLGIRLNSRGISVLRKYGTPTKVMVGDDALILFQVLRLPDKDFLTVAVNNLDATGGAGPAGAPGTTGPFPGGSNPFAPGTSGPFGPTSGPYGPSASGPYGPSSGPYGAPGAPGFNNPNGVTQTGKFVFWVYQYPQKGLTNLFVLDEEGRVALIGQAGGRSSSKTSRGVGIGNTYADIVRVYGFPELHEKGYAQGVDPLNLLHISYEESHGVRFYFIDQKLRGYPTLPGKGPWCVAAIVTAGD